MPTPWFGMPAAARIAGASLSVSFAARSFGEPIGRSMTMPPVASRFQLCANCITSARCIGVRPPRPAPTNSVNVRSFSLIAIGWRAQ